MSESFTSASLQRTPEVAIEAEEIDALPVLAGQPHAPVDGNHSALPDGRRPAGVVMPAVQAAAVAAGGFVAGVAVVGLVQRRQRRSAALAKGRRAGRSVGKARRANAIDSRRGTARAVELVQIVGSRSLLVDVHLLGGSSDR